MDMFSSPLCVVVTGAGRGFGLSLCQALAEKLHSDSHLLLLGRNQEQLKKTKDCVLKISNNLNVSLYAEYECGSLDGSKLTSFLREISGSFTPGVISRLLVIHNAGTVGDPSVPSSDYAYMDVSSYMNVNFAAMIETNNICMRSFLGLKKTIVHISSICAVKPFKSLALYCAGKAARDMYMRVVAEEHPDIRVLNYAPGPLQTNMFSLIQQTSYDADMKDKFQELTSLDPLVSAKKLMDVLQADDFTSGSHVDYYDV